MSLKQQLLKQLNNSRSPSTWGNNEGSCLFCF